MHEISQSRIQGLWDLFVYLPVDKICSLLFSLELSTEKGRVHNRIGFCMWLSEMSSESVLGLCCSSIVPESFKTMAFPSGQESSIQETVPRI